MFLHPAEAVHGDLGMLMRGDVVVALSASGETEEIPAMLATVKRLEIPLISFHLRGLIPPRRGKHAGRQAQRTGTPAARASRRIARQPE